MQTETNTDHPTYPCDTCKVPVALEGNNLMRIGTRKVCIPCGKAENAEEEVITLSEHDEDNAVEIIIKRTDNGDYEWNMFIDMFLEGTSKTRESAESDARDSLKKLVYKLAKDLGYIE